MNLAIALLYSSAVFSLLIFFYYFLGYRSQKREWQAKVKNWFPQEQRKSLVSRLGDRFDEQDFAKTLHHRLQSINVGLLPSEYVAGLIVGGMTVFVLFYSIFNVSFSISLLLGVFIVTMTHFLLFYIRKNSYEEQFNDKLSEVCRIMGNAARSGLTINQGIDIVSREVTGPAGVEFKRISHELKLGVPLETALRSVQKRNKSRDFKLFIATLLIQKKTGGNLALTLETMAETFEERKVLHQTIKTMTAEQKYISYIVPILPVFLLLVMNNVIDGFLDPLWSGFGLIMLALFLGAVILSFVIIRKITSIKV